LNTATQESDIRHACMQAAADHDRLCPRQVLGVRMGYAGAAALCQSSGDATQRMLIFAETDGCFVDGVAASTGCTVGHRTMRIVDYGRVAITVVDTASGRAVRIAPQPGIREHARAYAPGEHRRYYAQMIGYEHMPVEELLSITEVDLTEDLRALLGERGVRVDCVTCGEEVLNRREVITRNGARCAACAGVAYYSPKSLVSAH